MSGTSPALAAVVVAPDRLRVAVARHRRHLAAGGRTSGKV